MKTHVFDPQNFTGRALSEIRTGLGLTNEELGIIIGTSDSMVSRHCHAEVVDERVVSKLIEFFRLRDAYFYQLNTGLPAKKYTTLVDFKNDFPGMQKPNWLAYRAAVVNFLTKNMELKK